MLASPEVDEVNRKLSLVTCTTIVGLAGVGACRWVSAKHDGRPSRTKIHWEQFNEQPKMCLSYCRLYGCYPGSAALGAPQDPWTQAQVITPEQLAKELSNREPRKPTLINVAFRV